MNPKEINTVNRSYVQTILFGIIATVISYYGYGLSDQVEQLPQVLRHMDPGYLSDDFFVNSTFNTPARGYYSKIIAFISGSEAHLPYVAFSLVLLSNIAVSLVTYRLSRQLHNDSDMAGVYAAATVMIARTFGFGFNSAIYFRYLVPFTLAFPLTAGATLAFLNRRAVWGTILCMMAIAVHPLSGIELGALLLSVFIFSSAYRREPLRAFVPIAPACLAALILFFLTLYGNPFASNFLSTSRFIYILAYFRHPHHYLLRAFQLQDVLYACLFLLSLLMAYAYTQRHQRNNVFVTILLVSLPALSVCGYVFVELLPSRLATTAQMFRLLFYFKWLGLIVIAGNLAASNLGRLSKPLGLAGLVHPFSAAWTVVFCRMAPHIKNRKLEGAILAGGIAILFSFAGVPAITLTRCLLILSVVVLPLLSKRILYRRIVPVVILFLGGLLVTAPHFYYSYKLLYYARLKVEKFRDYFILMPDFDQNGADIARFAKQYTPKDAIFLTPPGWGQFRLLAKRAIVVDFKAFPFTDAGMTEWYMRINNCYGMTASKGFEALKEMDNAYIAIDDKKINSLKEKYNISIAVLYAKTPTQLKIIYQNSEYKLVKI